MTAGPRRAQFGAVDNRHALISWNGAPASPPAGLEGLTDKPPGTYAPGERWAPSVGCGPVRDWWALWWTDPDDGAARGGMVRSEVALWPAADIAFVDDLGPAMQEIAGREIPAAPPELVAEVAEALVAPDPRRPVVADLDVWPGVLLALWPRLWPNVRRCFAARVAASPPSGFDTDVAPALFGISPERAPQWSGHRVIAPSSIRRRIEISRGAQWLAGGEDFVLGEVLQDQGVLPADIRCLRRAARAADLVEQFRGDPTGETALALLRPLMELYPDTTAAAPLKREALDALDRTLEDAPLKLVRALANLDAERLDGTALLTERVRNWTVSRLPDFPPDDTAFLIVALTAGKAQSWWQRSVRNATVEGLSGAQPRWAALGLSWLGSETIGTALDGVLPADADAERRLLDAAPAVPLAHAAFGSIRSRAAARGWSRLHAWALLHSAPADAMRVQLTFPGDAGPGLELLAERMDGSAVIDAALSDVAPRILHFVAARTVREPALLARIDAAVPAWRRLWTAHIATGGPAWPPGVDLSALSRSVLDAVIRGDPADELVNSLAADLAHSALVYPERASLWKALGARGRPALLRAAAEAAANEFARGRPLGELEPDLAAALAVHFELRLPSPMAIIALLRSGVPIDEEQLIAWISACGQGDWARMAESLGQEIQRRSWSRCAARLDEIGGSSTGLGPAVWACRGLLSPWRQLVLSCFRPGQTAAVDVGIVLRRTAELGARTAAERLEYLWERAGGTRARLASNGSPADRWHEAVRLAHAGAIAGGVGALVHELRQDFPHNPDLVELEHIVRRMN